MLQQLGGQFFLSDEKIKEYSKAGLSAESYSQRRYKELTDFILENSTIKKLSKMTTDSSAFGLVYQLTLNDGVQSPFVKLNIDDATPEHRPSTNTSTCTLDGFNKATCMKPIRTFLLKLSILDNIGETNLLRIRGNTYKLTVKEKDFGEEADLQNQIYEDTYEMGESIAPACIFPSYIDNIQASATAYNKILNILVKSEIDSDFYLKSILKEAVKKRINRFGIIIMEFADGYKTLTEILSDRTADVTTKNKAMIQAKIAHLKLYESGYVHGDCHASNIMINLDYVGFMTPPNTGKGLLIDFGRTKRILPVDIIQRKLPNKLGPENYQAVLEYASWVSNLRGAVAHPPYTWIKTPVFKMEENVLYQVLNSIEANVFRKLGKIKGALPSVLTKDSIFVKFLEHPSFSNFETLRWREIAMGDRLPKRGFVAPAAAPALPPAPVFPVRQGPVFPPRQVPAPVFPPRQAFALPLAAAPAPAPVQVNIRSRAQSPVPNDKPYVPSPPVLPLPPLPPQPPVPEPVFLSPKIQRLNELPRPQPRNRDLIAAAMASTMRRKPVINTKVRGEHLSIADLYPKLPNAPQIDPVLQQQQQQDQESVSSIPILIPKQQLANLCARMGEERRIRSEKKQKAGRKTRKTVKASKRK